MRTQSFLLTGALLLAALGCRDDAGSPTEPRPAPQGEPAAATPLTFRQVSADEFHSCGVDADYRAYCWGANGMGRLGAGTNTGLETCSEAACSTRPLAVAGGLRFRHVSTGIEHTCGVTTDNLAYCWGDNFDGQLGDGTESPRLTPVAVAGGLRFRQVDVGGYHTCGVTTTNRAYCWGTNSGGILGDGTTTDRMEPVAVRGGLRFRQVSAGVEHTCGLTTDSLAYCWGYNASGALGDGSTTTRLRPVAVQGGRRFRQVSAGAVHTCGVTGAYRAFCWGGNHMGQLGDGTTEDRRRPVAVGGGLHFERVTAGEIHTCGETEANRAYCWGSNSSGQLGDGTRYTERLTPAPVLSNFFFAQVGAGGWHTCGLTSTALAYCWGDNIYGAVGDGTTTDRLRPTPVAGPS